MFLKFDINYKFYCINDHLKIFCKYDSLPGQLLMSRLYCNFLNASTNSIDYYRYVVSEEYCKYVVFPNDLLSKSKTHYNFLTFLERNIEICNSEQRYHTYAQFLNVLLLIGTFHYNSQNNPYICMALGNYISRINIFLHAQLLKCNHFYNHSLFCIFYCINEDFGCTVTYAYGCEMCNNSTNFDWCTKCSEGYNLVDGQCIKIE